MACEQRPALLSTEAANQRRGSLPSTPPSTPPATLDRILGLSVETQVSPSTQAKWRRDSDVLVTVTRPSWPRECDRHHVDYEDSCSRKCSVRLPHGYSVSDGEFQDI